MHTDKGGRWLNADPEEPDYRSRQAKPTSAKSTGHQEELDRPSTRQRALSGSRAIAVDTSRAKSNQQVVRHCLEKLGWKEFPSPREDGKPCDIYWHNVVYGDLKEVVPSGAKVNRFPGMNELSRKISLTRAITSMQKLFPAEFDFYPRSWLIPTEMDKFYEDYYNILDEQEEGQVPWFIAKPDDGAQGGGIYLMNSPDDLVKIEEPQIIQEYLAEPFLLQDNLKFDLRIYAVIKSLNPLSIYVSNEGMARFCTKQYSAPTVDNIDEAYIHLTNYSLNKTNEQYVHASTLADEGSKRLLTTVFHQMEARGINTRKIWNSIKMIIVKTVLAMVPEMILQYESHFSQKTFAPSCFQIMGFDVLLTKDLKPILLEVNACPSLTLSHDSLSSSQVTDDEKEPLYSVVDEAIKVPLVRDTLLLAMDQLPIRNHKQPARPGSSISIASTMSMDDLCHSTNARRVILREVFPARFNQSCGHLLVLDKMAYLFMHFVSIRRSLLMTMTIWRLVARKCHLFDVITLNEMDKIYCEVQKNYKNSGDALGIPFHGFVRLMIFVAKRKFPNAASPADALCGLMTYCQMKLRHHGVRSARLRHEVVESIDEPSLKQIYLLPGRAIWHSNSKRRKPNKGPRPPLAPVHNGVTLPKII